MEQFKENYQNQNERMNPQLENMLKSMQSDLANNPAFPKTDANGNPINFIELIGYKRFLDVIEKVKRYTNLQNVTGGGLGQLSSMLMQGVQFIQQVEAPHKRELENLAVDLVVEEMEIPDGAFQFQCKLVPVGSINQDGFQIDGKEPNEEDINQAFQEISQDVEIPADELFEDEKHKRRFINMLIQGSSKKGHYMFELVRRKVNEYNPNLAETYGKVMSINDLLYWILDDETVRRMAESDSSMGGKEGIEEGEDGDTIIKTEAICFPISLHEIIKGIMEVFGTQGLPDDPQQANLVINAVDSLSNETMDLRLGVPCWEKIYSAYPDFILEEGNRYLQNYLFARYCALPTDEFFRVSRLILSDDPKGAKYFAKMVDEIQNDLQREDYEQNIDDINLDDLLGYKNGGGVGKYYGGNYLTNKDLKELENWNFIEKDRIRIIPEINEYGTRFGYNVEYLDENGQWEGSYSVSAYSKREAFEKLKDKFQGKEYSNGGGVRKYTGGGGVGKIIIETQPPKSLSNKQIRLAKEIANEVVKTGLDATIEYDSGTIDIKIIYGNKFSERLSTGRFRVFWSRTGDNKIQYLGVGVGHYDGYEIKRGWSDDLNINEVQNFVKKDKDYYDSRKYAIGSNGGSIDLLAVGGMIDLFEDYENIPPKIQKILDFYEDDFQDGRYDGLSKALKEVEANGYTFEYYLDGVAYGLRPKNVPLNKLKGYEDEVGMIDLFEDYENIPANVKSILDEYELEESDYDTLLELQNRLEDIGYTFEFGLDAEPFALRPSNVKITELQGYEDFDDSDKFNVGGEAEFDVYNWDDKMALINIGQIYEYAIELDEIIDEDTQLEEWVKMKLTRIEQNIADVKHSLEGWEKYSSGGQIAKKQLLHIAKYSKDLIEMISNGSKLMSWQEGKLSVSAQSIDDIYHHLDYKMGNRAVDLENESGDKYGRGRQVKVVDFNPKSEKEYDIKEFTEIAIKKYSKKYDAETIKKEVNKNRNWYEYTNETFLNRDLKALLDSLRILEVGKTKIKYINKKYKINDTFFVEYFIFFHDKDDDIFDVLFDGLKNKPSGYYLQFRIEELKNFEEYNIISDKNISIIYGDDFTNINMLLFETKSETPTNYKKAIEEGKNKIPALKEYFVEFLDKTSDLDYGDEESEGKYVDGGFTGNSFVNVLLDYGFVETDEYMTDGRLFQKQKYFVEIDEKNKNIEISKYTDERGLNLENRYQFNYSCNSPKDLIDFLNENGLKSEKFTDGGGVDSHRLRDVVYEVIKSDDKWRIIAKYNSFDDYLIGRNQRKPYIDTNDWRLDLILFNIKRFDKDNLLQFIPNLNVSEIYDKYIDGGDVQGWMKEALLNLQLVEDDNSLQITHTNDDSFYVEGDSAEYRVFKTYDNAYDTAIEQVREDLEENPDFFNQDWLMNWVDVDDTIENILEEYYRSYADDIAFEDDSRYKNRLIAEMVANGLMTEEEATSENADDVAEDNVDNLVDLYVEENMEGDKGVEWYISNFGQDDFRDLVIDNNLIDISGASEDAIDTDGVAHFLSSYDGEEIELDNDVVAYRTN